MKKQIKTIYLWLDFLARKLAQIIIRLYQWTFSPDKSPFLRNFLGGRICRHNPHCSQYWYECFSCYGFFTASYRTMDRISRCTPGIDNLYDPVRYRVVFASWSPIWVPFIEALVNDPRYDVVWILTMPDMPSGRWMKIQENIIAVKGWELNIKSENIRKPKSLRLDSKKYENDAKDTYAWLKSLDVDILYVVAYGNIIPQYILDIPKIAPINIHGSLLPTYRGASPLQTVFLDGLKETGITLMKMEAWLDSWPMIDQQIFKLGFSDTVADLIQRVKNHTPKWSLDSIDKYVHAELEEEKQDEKFVTHCGKIEKEDWLLDIDNETIESIYRKYKAYFLWPKVYFQLKVKSGQSKIIVVDELLIDEKLFVKYKDQCMFVDNQYKLNWAIENFKVKPEWGKTMLWEEFLRGNM
jgi:methionyl-tRNA formyltransferase